MIFYGEDENRRFDTKRTAAVLTRTDEPVCEGTAVEVPPEEPFLFFVLVIIKIFIPLTCNMKAYTGLNN